jgi:pimeloyl-ACP methyl ester carboxylesterase
LLSQGEPSFDVVVPTHPGFGFSDRPTRRHQIEPADLYPKLMTALSHERFMVSETDVGSSVATRIALRHPDRVIATHVSAIAEKPRAPDASPPSAAERDYEARAKIWNRDEGAYGAIQSSKPQSLAFALADSPVGLANWIVEKFRNWSDCRRDVLSVFPPEVLTDNPMIY